MAQAVSWIFFLLPWVLLYPLDSQRVKRFAPVGLFSALVITIIFQIAEKWNWWIINNNLFFLTSISSFVYGFLIVATILVFYFSYPNFLFYMIANLIIDAIQAFIISPFLFIKVGLYNLHKINAFELFLLMTLVSLIIYGYQKWQDTVFDETKV
ncbi:hypothetical protein [Priestia endophytica]|uniref:hypothetical protein n=1 Tax=Priestia endophytica TaxID=135735 RepID=UPI002E1EADFB|nr:hypothetical protein [Priestia endophytica]